MSRFCAVTLCTFLVFHLSLSQSIPTIPPSPSVSTSSSVFNVVHYGATGDGVTDDTHSFQLAIAALYNASKSGVLYVPAGSYRITQTLMMLTNAAVTIEGDGWVSNLLWEVVGHLFQWPLNTTASPVSGALVRDLMVSVAASWGPATEPYFALSFPCGLTQSMIHHFKVQSAYTGFGVSGIDMGFISDTVEWAHNILWMLTGIGVRIGKGSEIRITGGRVISTGPLLSPQGAIGVHVTGNNGGVHIVNTDVIAWNTGIVLDDSNGAGSNREIFISQATIDSNYRGLAIMDDSYVDITGCWAASSVVDNIWTMPGGSPQLVITGGTIFNAGTYGGNCSFDECNGITINGGTVTISSLEIRNNQGRGVWIPNDGVDAFMMTGVKLFGNGVGIDILGQPSNGFVITSCFGYNNGGMNIPSDPQSMVSNNLFR